MRSPVDWRLPQRGFSSIWVPSRSPEEDSGPPDVPPDVPAVSPGERSEHLLSKAAALQEEVSTYQEKLSNLKEEYKDRA